MVVNSLSISRAMVIVVDMLLSLLDVRDEFYVCVFASLLFPCLSCIFSTNVAFVVGSSFFDPLSHFAFLHFPRRSLYSIQKDRRIEGQKDRRIEGWKDRRMDREGHRDSEKRGLTQLV